MHFKVAEHSFRTRSCWCDSARAQLLFCSLNFLFGDVPVAVAVVVISNSLIIICCTTEQVRGIGLFLGGRHRLICIVLSLCKHACKSVCDVHPEMDPYPLLARSCNRWWPDFVPFTACKKSRFGLKRGKKAQCVSNRCKDLFERKKYFGVRCTLTISNFITRHNT